MTTDVSFKDPVFLQYGLSEHNVLEYFAMSPFYDKSCINEQLKMQARFTQLQVSDMDKTRMVGFEYEVWFVKHNPSLFVIKKQNRLSPTDANTVALYYIVEGTIFQCPDLYSVFSNRVMTSLYYCHQALKEAQSSILFHPSSGYSWKGTNGDLLAIEQQEERVKTTSLEQTRHKSDFHQNVDNLLHNILKYT